MSYISDAHRPIVPKYSFSTNKAIMVLDNKYQAEEFIEPRFHPCQTKDGKYVHQVYPISGNECMNSPTVMMNRDWVQLPRVPLPYAPPQNLPHNIAPHFEPVVRMNRCSTIDRCDDLLQKLNRNSQGFNFVAS